MTQSLILTGILWLPFRPLSSKSQNYTGKQPKNKKRKGLTRAGVSDFDLFCPRTNCVIFGVFWVMWNVSTLRDFVWINARLVHGRSWKGHFCKSVETFHTFAYFYWVWSSDLATLMRRVSSLVQSFGNFGTVKQPSILLNQSCGKNSFRRHRRFTHLSA
jgi:hypothetical protein